MKKLLLLLIVPVTAILVISCQHKDNEANPSVKIIGKWNGTKMYELEYQNDSLIDADTTFLTPPDYFILEFNKDNTMTMDYSLQGESNRENGVYKIDNNNLILSGSQNDPEAGTYTFKFKENTLELINIDTKRENNQTIREEEYIFFTKQ